MTDPISAAATPAERDEAHGASYGRVLVEQLRWVAQRAWIWWIVLVVAMAAGFVLILWGASGSEQGRRVLPMALSGTLFPLMLLIAVSWGLTVWRDDPPKDRQYFWLQPVSRMWHTLARGLAGGAWLMLAVLVIMAVALVTTLLQQAPMLGWSVWILWLGAVLLAYLLTNIFAILTDRPALWIIAGFVIVVLLNALATMRQWGWLESATDVIVGGGRSLSMAFGAPSIAVAQRLAAENPGAGADSPALTLDPVGTLLLWLAIAAVAFVGAAWAARPR